MAASLNIINNTGNKNAQRKLGQKKKKKKKRKEKKKKWKETSILKQPPPHPISLISSNAKSAKDSYLGNDSPFG